MITRNPFSIDFILSLKTTKVENNKETTDENEDDVIPPVASRTEEGGKNDDHVTWTESCKSPQDTGLYSNHAFHGLFDISRITSISGSGSGNSSVFHPQSLENPILRPPARGGFSSLSTRTTAFGGFAVTSSNDAMTSSDLMNPVSAFHSTAALLAQREMLRLQVQQASRYQLLSTTGVFYPKVIQYNGNLLTTYFG